MDFGRLHVASEGGLSLFEGSGILNRVVNLIEIAWSELLSTYIGRHGCR